MGPNTLIPRFLLHKVTLRRVPIHRESINQFLERERRYLLDPDQRNFMIKVQLLSMFDQVVVYLSREDDDALDLGSVW